MDGLPSQQLQHVFMKDRKRLVLKIFQLLDAGGIKILCDHKELFIFSRNFPESVHGESAEADSHHKSSLPISETGRNKNVDILHIAAAYGSKKNRSGKTPLHLAAETGDTELVDVFLQAGADVEPKDPSATTSTHLISPNEISNIGESFLISGTSVNIEDIAKKTPLQLSAENGYKDISDICLTELEVNVGAQDNEKQTPLHLSAQNGYKQIVQTLLNAGANVNAKDKCKRTPLHLSAPNGYREICATLLKAGANVNAKDKYQRTALHLSAENGRKKVAETLLRAGAKVDIGDWINFTPLHISVIFKLLLRAGASVKERETIRRRSVLDYMDDQQRVRLGFEPRKLAKLRNLMHFLTKSKKHVESSTSSKTKTEHTETISATFTNWNSRRYDECLTLPCLGRGTIPIEENSNNKGQDNTSNDSNTLPTSEPQLMIEEEPQLSRSSLTSTDTVPLFSPSPQLESHVLDDIDLQELNNIRQQVQNYLAKFSPETTEGCETSCSSKVNTAFQSGRVIIPTKLKVTIKKIKNIKQINHYESGTNLNICHAENVAPGGKIVVYQNRKATDDDDSTSEDDSSSEDEIYVNI